MKINKSQYLEQIQIRIDEKPLENIGEIETIGTNRTKDSNILIYNRVPKCGSATMNIFLRKLSYQNSFKFKAGFQPWQ